MRFHTLSFIPDLFITQAIQLKCFVQLVFVPAAPAHRQLPPVWEQSACTCLVISLRDGSCSFVHVLSRGGIPSHTHTFCAVTHSQHKVERAKDDVDVGPDADTLEEVEIETEVEVEVGG